MLKFYGSGAVFKMGKSTSPRETELFCGGFFLPLGEIFDIVDRFVPEVGREFVNHPVHGFYRGHKFPGVFLYIIGIPCAII